MAELMLPSGVDKLSLPQKVVAGGLAGLALWVVGPTLLAMMVNLTMIVLIGIPMVFVAYNYKMVWLLFKNISWYTTKWLIGLDVLSYMDRYLEWVGHKKQVLISSRNRVQVELEGANTAIADSERDYNSSMNRAKSAESSGNTVQRDIALSAAQDAKDLIETLSPLRAGAEKQIAYLDELTDVYETKEQQLGNTIKTQKIKYKTLRNMSRGMGAAAEVLGEAGDANKQWQLTNEILISKMNQFTANIKTYEQVVKPAIEAGRFDKQLRQEKGLALLEEFRKTDFQLEK